MTWCARTGTVTCSPMPSFEKASTLPCSPIRNSRFTCAQPNGSRARTLPYVRIISRLPEIPEPLKPMWKPHATSSVHIALKARCSSYNEAYISLPTPNGVVC